MAAVLNDRAMCRLSCGWPDQAAGQDPALGQHPVSADCIQSQAAEQPQSCSFSSKSSKCTLSIANALCKHRLPLVWVHASCAWAMHDVQLSHKDLGLVEWKAKH